MAKPLPKPSRRLVLGGLLAVSVAAFAWMSATSDAFAGDALTPQEAHKRAGAGEIILIDIRRPDEWTRTGVPQHSQPLDMRRNDFIPALLALTQGRTDAPIALICARGVRSDRMSARLTQAGFTRIIDVPEGMLGSRAGPGWLERKLPVTQVQ